MIATLYPRDERHFMKGKIRICWWCGRQLYGNHHKIIHYEGYDRVCHKICAENLEEGRTPMPRDDKLLESESYPAGSRYGIIKRKNITSQFS